MQALLTEKVVDTNACSLQDLGQFCSGGCLIPVATLKQLLHLTLRVDWRYQRVLKSTPLKVLWELMRALKLNRHRKTTPLSP
jgi:hypothetical protein